jgi:hypothetical protein
MLLSIDHPELLPHLKTLSYGLQPVFHRGEERYFLVVKVTKEMILTARLNGEFKIYLLDDEAGPESHLGLITAFFDDPDEPLTIKSPQFADDDLLKDLTGLLSQPEFDIYFFDEHDRELMGVRGHNAHAGRFRAEMAAATFPPFDHASFPAFLRRLEHRFSVRDAEDDTKALTITLGERLYPDDFIFVDGRDAVYQFQDADRIVAATSLEREQPGPFQERDIAVMLGRVFDGQCIYLNPIRDDTGKELTDVMVVTEAVMMLVQAKDSPNTEAALRRNIRRKRAAIRSHIDKACKQLRGALSYAEKTGAVVIRTPEGFAALPVGDRLLLGLVVVREMFDDDYAACSVPVLNVSQAVQLPAVLTDYSGLHIMAQRLLTPIRFMNGLCKMFEIAIERNEFPKPAYFGPPPRD